MGFVILTELFDAAAKSNDACLFGSLCELAVAPLEQAKLQDVLASLRAKVDTVTLITDTKAQAEVLD